MLHVPVRTIRKTLLLLARRVQPNQIACDVLHLVLRPLLESFPLSATKSCDRRFGTLTAFVLTDAVQVMDAHKHIRTVAVIEFDHLLRFTVNRRRDESTELRNTVIAVHDVIAYLQLVDLP